ncbi:hypothetical protein L4D79_06255 [Photobacterium satsumensis]
MIRSLAITLAFEISTHPLDTAPPLYLDAIAVEWVSRAYGQAFLHSPAVDCNLLRYRCHLLLSSANYVSGLLEAPILSLAVHSAPTNRTHSPLQFSLVVPQTHYAKINQGQS